MFFGSYSGLDQRHTTVVQPQGNRAKTAKQRCTMQQAYYQFLPMLFQAFSNAEIARHRWTMEQADYQVSTVLFQAFDNAEVAR